MNRWQFLRCLYHHNTSTIILQLKIIFPAKIIWQGETLRLVIFITERVLISFRHVYLPISILSYCTSFSALVCLFHPWILLFFSKMNTENTMEKVSNKKKVSNRSKQWICSSDLLVSYVVLIRGTKLFIYPLHNYYNFGLLNNSLTQFPLWCDNFEVGLFIFIYILTCCCWWAASFFIRTFYILESSLDNSSPASALKQTS